MFLLKIIPRLKSGKHDLICQIFCSQKKKEIINKKVKCKDYFII